jgi:hypothetical protein
MDLMKNNIYFDHIEAHVADIARYCIFLQNLFPGGRYKIISDNGTAMFKTRGGLNIEIKKKNIRARPGAAGFCNPCVRMNNAKRFIQKTLQLKITKTVKNPDGNCHFFIDHEGITWHIKDYAGKDKFINW